MNNFLGKKENIFEMFLFLYKGISNSSFILYTLLRIEKCIQVRFSYCKLCKCFLNIFNFVFKVFFNFYNKNFQLERLNYTYKRIFYKKYSDFPNLNLNSYFPLLDSIYFSTLYCVYWVFFFLLLYVILQMI